MSAVRKKRLAPLDVLAAGELLVNEIFASIQGESTHAGRPCTFVRTAVCHLRCSYCDTRYAFADGRRMRVDEVVAQVDTFGLGLVEVTGGEPLLQAAAYPLMQALADRGHEVLLETSGSIDIGAVDPRVRRIVDFKAPSSGEEPRNLYANVEHLRPTDEVKLVLADEEDYIWARALVARYRLHERATVLAGPVFGRLDPALLAEWIVRDRLPVRLQLQLHKILWRSDARGV